MIASPTQTLENLPLSNESLAQRLDELAELLEAQRANPFRVRAYRTAAESIRTLREPVTEILARDGTAGLLLMPGIGTSLARAIEQLAQTGRLPLLEQLRGDTVPERVLATVPGIGARTAARIHAELGIDTLAELEAAAYDGRLAEMPGMGPKRIQAIRDSIAGRFRRRSTGRDPFAAPRQPNPPPLADLLSIDEEYRRKAAAD